MKYYSKIITKMATIFTFCCVIEILTEDTAAADKEIRMGGQRNTSGEVSSSTLNILIIFNLINLVIFYYITELLYKLR